jgi:hypothetical protein
VNQERGLWKLALPKTRKDYPPLVVDESALLLVKIYNAVDRAQGHVVPVTFDHNPNQTVGRVGRVEIRDEGLWAEMLLNREGEEAVLTSRYIGLSPTLEEQAWGDGVTRPVRMVELALTNVPDFRESLRHYGNRQVKKTLMRNDTDSDLDYRTELCTYLGLSPGASDEAIKQALNQLQHPVSRATKGPSLKQKVLARKLRGTIRNKNTTSLAWEPWTSGIPQVIPGIAANSFPREGGTVAGLLDMSERVAKGKSPKQIRALANCYGLKSGMRGLLNDKADRMEKALCSRR